MNDQTSLQVVVNATQEKERIDLVNTALIAAAPELLAVLLQVRFALFSGADLSETFECRCDDRENGHVCLGYQIEFAIAKAKGEL